MKSLLLLGLLTAFSSSTALGAEANCLVNAIDASAYSLEKGIGISVELDCRLVGPKVLTPDQSTNPMFLDPQSVKRLHAQGQLIVLTQALVHNLEVKVTYKGKEIETVRIERRR